MYEVIVDTTNQCVLRCALCGTDASKKGNVYLAKEKLIELIDFAASVRGTVFLGGGCFFCHPAFSDVLHYLRETVAPAKVVIDVPLERTVLSYINRFPGEAFHYQISASLWGGERTHNALSCSDGYRLLPDYMDLMRRGQGRVSLSYVITKRLLGEEKELAAFINGLGDAFSVYFHRLMPTGRCGREMLPSQEAVVSFADSLKRDVVRSELLSFHHTIYQSGCPAYSNRIFVDWNGDVFGCGWVGDNPPMGNIYDTGFAELVGRAEALRGTYRCPLLG